MEAFSLLKYWRGAGAAGAGAGAGLLSLSHTSTPSSTLTAPPLTQNATDSDDDDNDEGPFFDLEFTVPDEEVDNSEDPKPNRRSSNSSNTSDHHSQDDDEEEEENDNIEDFEGEGEFKFTLSPSANDRSDLSPSDDLFFKGKLVEVDPSSFEPNSKPPQFTASLFKSATKFRVFMSGLKKSKSNTDSLPPNQKPPESDTHIPESQKKQQHEKKLFTVKFKVEEVPIMSLFTRDNSSKGNNNNNKSQNQKQNPEDSPSSSSKEVMHKYLKMVKPLYIRVSRRYGDKLGFSGHLNLASEGKGAPPQATAEKKNSPAKADGGGGGESAGTNGKGQKQGNLPAGLRVVCKHLGKSRSASSTVAAAPPPPSSSKRRDDSLLQQQDGIQGAILHCKRSFNASRECQASQLPRSVSDPLHDISSRKSTNTNEGKDKHL